MVVIFSLGKCCACNAYSYHSSREYICAFSDAKYLIGIAFVAGGLAWAAYKLGTSPIWISIGVIIILGIGIMAAVSKTQLKEKSNTGK